jgi:hypothetical protein
MFKVIIRHGRGGTLVRGVIIEGLSTSGKTSVFSALKRLQSQTPNIERTMIAVSEHYSQVLHGDHGVLRSLEQQEHIRLLQRHIDYLEQLYSWIDSLGHTKPANGVFYILERFHLNHRKAFGASSEIQSLEERLLKLNAHCVLLTLSPEVVESRFIESRGQDWKSYVMRDGYSVAAACERFLSDQDELRQCAKHSLIPTREIRTDDADWDSYAQQIMWMLTE